MRTEGDGVRQPGRAKHGEEGAHAGTLKWVYGDKGTELEQDWDTVPPQTTHAFLRAASAQAGLCATNSLLALNPSMSKTSC